MIKDAIVVLQIELAIILVMLRKILRIPTLKTGDTMSCLRRIYFYQVSKGGSDIENENHDCADSVLFLVEFNFMNKILRIERDGRFTRSLTCHRKREH